MKIRNAFIDGVQREAAFSDDGKYRYRLDLYWNPDLPTLCTIGLNCSIADHLKNDPTITRCVGFAHSLNCGSYRMLNAFALISTDYKALFHDNDPVGPENTIEFLQHWTDGTIAVAAWGSHMTSRSWKHYYRGHNIAEAIPGLKCFKRTQSGHPQHPLYLPKTLKPIPFAYLQ